MEIKLYSENSVTPLSSNDMMIVDAINSDLVNNVSDQELKEELLKLVASAFLTAGYKAPETTLELNILLGEIISELRRIKTNIRIKEISIAFKNGVHKKYGEYMGLSAVSFCQFIKEYLKEEPRAEALRQKNTPKETRTPSEQEIYNLSVENCKTAFSDLKSKGTVGRFGVIVYDFLTKIGILQLDKETRWQYYEDAKSDLQEYLKSKMFNCNDKHEVNRLKSDLNSIIEGVKTQSNEQKLITISKRLAVDDYFRGLEMEGLTIEEVLK